MPVTLTVRLEFEAAHRLYNPERDADWNRRVYGKCANPRGHGHNYVLEVTVRGPVDPETGYVVDLARLKALVRREVVDGVDHRHLNHDVPWLEGTIPTAENLAAAFYRRIAAALPEGLELAAVTVWETPRNAATFSPG